MALQDFNVHSIYIIIDFITNIAYPMFFLLLFLLCERIIFLLTLLKLKSVKKFKNRGLS